MKTLISKKSVRKSFMGIMALCIAAGSYVMMSFAPTAESSQTGTWWQFNGGDPLLPSSYSPMSGPNPPSNCLTGDEVCAIRADNNGHDQPEITTELADQITDTLAEEESSTDVKVRDSQ